MFCTNKYNMKLLANINSYFPFLVYKFKSLKLITSYTKLFEKNNKNIKYTYTKYILKKKIKMIKK